MSAELILEAQRLLEELRDIPSHEWDILQCDLLAKAIETLKQITQRYGKP